MRKMIILLITCLIFAGLGIGYWVYQNQIECTYDFEPIRLKGKTKDGTDIVLALESTEGEIAGYGFHLFKSGTLHDLEISGSIDCETGEFEFFEDHLASKEFFGRVKGKLMHSNSVLTGIWTDYQGLDPTVLQLDTTSLNRSEILASIKKERENTIGDFAKDITNGAAGKIYDGAAAVADWFKE